jgi:hypothetical protein
MANEPTEQEKAELSTARGKRVEAPKAGDSPEEISRKQKEVSRQGDLEAAGKLKGSTFEDLKKRGTLSFEHGGIVPGITGEPKLAVVHGGEEVIPVSPARTVVPASYGMAHRARMAQG